MQKYFFRIMFFISIIILLTSCGRTSTTSGLYKVVDKEVIKDKNWIVVEGLENKPEQAKLKVEDVSTWNLIVKDDIYLITYDSKYNSKDHIGTLTHIQYADKSNTTTTTG